MHQRKNLVQHLKRRSRSLSMASRTNHPCPRTSYASYGIPSNDAHNVDSNNKSDICKLICLKIKKETFINETSSSEFRYLSCEVSLWKWNSIQQSAAPLLARLKVELNISSLGYRMQYVRHVCPTCASLQVS